MVSDNMASYSDHQIHHKNSTDLPDPRTADWPLMMSLPEVLILVTFYCITVTKVGPKLMQNREPFKLTKIIAVHNAIQVLLSCYMFLESAAIFRHYDWKCQAVDFTPSQLGLRAARVAYIYYVAKISELLDTIFFVLRKKQEQVSFLHVYHHGGLILYSWLAVRNFPGGNYMLMTMMNSFVHIVMYTYYFLSGITENYKERLWWKKHITHIQVTQFFIGLVHCALLFIYDCGYPWLAYLIGTPNLLLLIELFRRFYIRAYTVKDEVADEMEKKRNHELKSD